MERDYDFSGWATRNDIRCADGRTIRRDAFKDDDGKIVPLVWMHGHSDVSNVLGHALLENRPEGVYTYGWFNDTPQAQDAKTAVAHRDIDHLSIYANKLKQKKGGDVLHGSIKEVSLVLAGANPGAFIDVPTLAHSEEELNDYDATIYTDEELELAHANSEEEEEEQEEAAKEDKKVADKEKTVKDVFDELTEEQKNVVYFMIGQALEDAKGGSDDDDDDVEHYDMYGGYDMKHNVFDMEESYGADTLTHDDMEVILKDAKKQGSLSESVLAHAEDYGIDGIEWLFPEDRNLNNTPEWIKRDTEWVQAVMGAVHHTPFSRVKSQFANITEDEARARGYIKGKLKKEEVFSLLKRATTPQTVYKKQKMDRDDIIDITDFDVVAWIKGEMRMMLNEELARAFLIGDGRLASDDDKISEDHVRPIANDADLFTIKKAVTFGENATEDDKAKAVIRAAVKARKDYKGSGNPTLFTTEDWLTDMLLLEDDIGHKLYKTEQELATAMRVSKIVTVPVMEGHQVGGKNLIGIIVNLADYNVGADKGGAINMFEDFDIDYNQEKYLIETRCSGALTKPYSAIVLFENEVPASVDGGVVVSKSLGFEEADMTGVTDPADAGLYEKEKSGRYFLTKDTTVVTGKTYYQRKSA